MRHYEIVFLVHPDQSEQVPAMIDRYKEMVNAGNGTVHRVEDWGRRRLAYMINEVHKAHYVMINIECGLDILADIERNFKFNDSILRHLVIRRKSAITDESSMAIEKAREDAAEAAKVEQSEPSATDNAENKGAENDDSSADDSSKDDSDSTDTKKDSTDEEEA